MFILTNANDQDKIKNDSPNKTAVEYFTTLKPFIFSDGYI